MFEVWVSFKTSGGFGFEFGFDLPCRALSALSQAVPTEGPQQTRPLNASLRSPCFPRSCPRLWIQNLRRWVVRNEFWRFYEVTKGLWQTLLIEWYALDGFDYHILILCQFMHTVNAYFFLAYPLQSYNRFNCFNGHKNTQTLLLAKTNMLSFEIKDWIFCPKPVCSISDYCPLCIAIETTLTHTKMLIWARSIINCLQCMLKGDL